MAWLKETLLAVPRVALLIPKLIADPRVPPRTKLALAGLAAYLATPWDIIPDFIPVLGQLDDAAAILLFVDGVLNQVDDAVLLEHWTGNLETFRHLQKLAQLVARWVPSGLKEFLFGRAVVAGQKRHNASAPSQS